MYLCVRGIDLTSFDDFAIRCSDSMGLFLFFICLNITQYNRIDKNNGEDQPIKCPLYIFNATSNENKQMNAFTTIRFPNKEFGSFLVTQRVSLVE
jgi:hypothetical protein